MSNENRVKQILEVEYPVIQGAMAGVSNANFVAAVSEAGGLGTLQTAFLDKEQLEEEIEKIQERTSKPFSVNFPLAGGDDTEELLNVALDKGVEIFTLSAGDPRGYVDQLEDARVKMQVIPTAGLASRIEDLGFDIIIAEGNESGGDISLPGVSTLSLVPSVSDKVDIPVIAAGGIADKETALAAKALGAEGVQMGTRFLASPTWKISDEVKELLVDSGEEDVVSLSHDSMGVNAIKNKYVNELLERLESGEDFEMMERLERQDKGLSEGDAEEGLVIAGRSVGRIKEIKSVEEIVEEIGEALLSE